MRQSTLLGDLTLRLWFFSAFVYRLTRNGKPQCHERPEHRGVERWNLCAWEKYGIYNQVRDINPEYEDHDKDMPSLGVSLPQYESWDDRKEYDCGIGRLHTS